MPPGVNIALARRAEWHWMFTATGFMVMWVAATRHGRGTGRPAAEPLRADAELVHGSRQLGLDRGALRIGQVVPSGRVAATLARCMHRSEVPPMPTPTMVGGQTRPPNSMTRSMTKRLIA